MLASKNRLKSKADFARIEIDGKLFQFKNFGVGIYDRNDDSPSRFGIVVSTKISKKAVIRNQIKRIIARVLRQKIGEIRNGLDLVFLIKPSILPIDRPKIEKEVYEVFLKNLQSNNLSKP